ncbi:unnamed protein product [Sphagnum balticum]
MMVVCLLSWHTALSMYEYSFTFNQEEKLLGWIPSTCLLLVQRHLKKFELDEDSTQAMKRFVIYLVFATGEDFNVEEGGANGHLGLFLMWVWSGLQLETEFSVP